MSVKLSPMFNSQIVDENGNPAAGWKVYTYVAGSVNTPQAAYVDAEGQTAHANPIVLDALGFPMNGQIWMTTGRAYKLVLTDENDVVKETADYISGVNDSSSDTSQWTSSGLAPTYVSASSFTVAGDQTTEFHVGRRLQLTVTSGTVYGTISAVEYTSLTTVTVAIDDGDELDSGLSEVSLSILRADHSALPAVVASGRQRLINGAAEVAQRTTAPNLSTSAQYGQVDMVAMWASGGTVSAGTLAQTTAATVGRTGKAARAAGVTLTGSGQLSWRYRMEAADAVKFKNQAASFQIGVMHDVGSSINYTIIIRKAGAADDFSSPTVIATGSAVSVPTATARTLSLANVSMGDCSNGIEIEIRAACGAVTTKNFDFTEWQLEEGEVCSEFEYRDYASEWQRCRRFYRAWAGETTVSKIAGFNNRFQRPSWMWEGMRGTPTITLYTSGGSANALTEFSTGSNYATTMGSSYLETSSATTYDMVFRAVATSEL